MRKITLFIFLTALAVYLLTSNLVYSQSSANYTFSTTTTGSLATDLNANTVDMSTGTTQISGSSVDQGVNASAITIGFDFFLMGNRYSQFNATTNGLVSLSSTSTSASGSGYLVSAGTTTTPIISAFAADLGTGTSGKTHYKVVGSAPNRCLVIEFSNMTLTWTSNYTNDGTFQVRLYESTGVIEFVYGAMSITSNASASDATVGIGFATNTTTNNLLYITSSTNLSSTTASFTDNTAYSTGAITNLNSASNGSRRTYVMTPPTPTAPTSLSFTSVSVSGMTLNWTDNASNERAYAIYRSTDNVNFTFVTTAAANAVSSVQSGLSPGTTYYWRVYAVTEGGFSTALSGTQATSSPSLSGTITVGTGGTYNNLTLAIAAINSLGLSGPLQIQLIAGYPAAAETYPITFGSLIGISATNTVTVYPTTSGLSITSANTTATIDLNASQYLTIDGRVNQAGAMDLVVANTSTSGVAIRFINEAQNNRVFYCNVQGVNTSATSAVVLFSTTTGSTGNDGNRIDNCNIRDGASTPTNGIYALGTTTSTTHNNSNDTISNCNIFNFFLATGSSNGLLVSSGNTDWVITGNSFYQTVSPRTQTAAGSPICGIQISNTSGNNFTISGNYIGGGSASCGGSAWTIGGSFANRFRGISLSVGTTTATSVQNNTIANFSFTSNSSATTAGGPWVGIYLINGNANVGTTTGNVIGNSSTGSIVIGIVTNSGSVSSGIYCDATTTTSNFSNNTIGSVTFNTSSVGQGFSGMVFTSTSTGTLTVNSNTIGNTSTANSININTGYTGATSQILRGINSSITATMNITNNTIANLTNNYPSSATNSVTLLSGITTSAGVNTITGNTVRNMTINAQAIGTGSTPGVVGISNSSTTTSLNLSQNIVHSLSSTHSSAATYITGIFNNGPTTSATIARNFIHSLSLSTSSTSAVINGLYIGGGTSTYQNNMIRLGINAAGSSITTALIINGINEFLGTNTIIHNSVYIGGTGVGSTATNTFAFNASQSGTTRVFRNNIFVNDRQNATTGGVHLAAQFAGTFPNATGLTLSHNCYFASTASATIRGVSAATNYTITGWQAASNADAGSFVVTSLSQISFVDATGGSGTVDLHVTGTTAIEASGTASTTATDDYDGATRSGLTPVDIGADAGNFTALDVAPPAISYTALGNGSVATTRVLTGFATITDNVAVSGGASAPRIYYKKSTDNDAFVGNTSGDNGWKYVSASNGSSPYDFTIDYTIINGGSVAAADVIQYFVVAQDAANNLGSQPSGATSSGNPPVQNINGKATTPNTYTIVGSISGTKNVGSGGDYATLTAAVTDLNSKIITGAVTFNLTDATYSGSETFPITINANSGSSVSNTVTIKPNTTATISGSTTSAPIIINGADYIIIDGSNNGSTSRDLTITNTNAGTSSACVWLQTATADGAQNNTVKNCVITGNSNTTTLFGIGSGSSTIGTTSFGTSNNSNTIQNNTISKTQHGIYSAGASSGNKNTGTVITQNLLNTASPNNIALTGIVVMFDDGVQITQNTLDNISVTTGTDVLGISCGMASNDLSNSGPGTTREVVNATISRNRLGIISALSATGFSSAGILVASTSSGTTNILNNVLTGVLGKATSPDVTAGIYVVPSTGSTTNVQYNSVSMTGTDAVCNQISAAFMVGGTGTGTLNVRNNIFYNAQTLTGTGEASVICMAHSTYTNITSDYNVLLSTGTASGTAMFQVGSLAVASGTNISSFAGWQSTSGKDANSKSANPQFQSTTNLIPVTTATSVIPELNNGTFISGVTTDYNGTTRSTTNPDIGAYEFTSTLNLTGAGNTTLPAGTYSGLTWTGNTLTFSGNVTIDGTLTLSNGIIVMGGNTLTIGTSKASPGSISYSGGAVRGTIKRWIADNTTTAILFPVSNYHWVTGSGYTDDYVAPTITFTGAGPTSGGSLTVRFDTTGSGTLSQNGGLGYISASALWPSVNFINLSPQFWTITLDDGLSGFTYDISLIGNGMGVSTSSTLYTAIAKRTNNTQPWAWNSSNHVMTSGTITPILGGTGFDTFSEFAILGNVDNLLPVELSSFTANVDRRFVTLNWGTSSEQNNVGYDIERKPESGSSWSKVGFVAGKGTTNNASAYTYLDRNLVTGKYNYRLKQMDNNGNYKYYVLSSLVEVGVPTKYDMSQNYPNPFNPTTKINYDLPFDSKVSIRLFDMTGREVANIVNATQTAGYYTAQFNGSNLASGVYFYNITAEGGNAAKFVTTKKMVLVK